MEKNNSMMSQKEEDSSVDLIEILREYLGHWKLFILIISISLLVGVVVYLTSSSKYSVASSVLLKEQKSANKSLSGLEELGLVSTTNNVDNEISIFKSPDLMMQVVQSLELQTSYQIKSGFKNEDIYKDSPYYVRLEDYSVQDFKDRISISLEKSGEGVEIEGTYAFSSGKDKILINGRLDTLPGSFSLPDNLGRLYIAPSGTKKAIDGNQYFVSIVDAEAMAVSLLSNLSMVPSTQNSSVLELKMTIGNRTKGKDILRELVAKYNEDNVKENNKTAFNTSVFINERLKDIAVELGSVEKDVEDYKQSQGITDLSSETQLYMQQTGANEQRKLDIETQLNVVNMVESYIKKEGNKDKPIPNIGITDPGLVDAITKYNSSLLEHQRLLVSTGESNPSRLRSEESLERMHSSISDAISNVKRAMSLSKKEIDLQNALTSSKIHSIPKQERGLLERARQQQIKENLYLFLLQKREETNITMASTSDKAKIIMAPRFERKVAPSGKIILAVAFLVGFILTVIIVYVRGLLNVTVASRTELEKLSHVPVIGEISDNDEGKSIVVDKHETSSIAELFRSLRNNIRFTFNNDKSKKVIMVTSTVSGEGKTFISTNLSMSFALNNKKVLLLGLDIRNPQLAKTLDLPVAKGITSYLNGDIEDWRDLILNYKHNENFSIIQAGIIPPNPNELLMNPLLGSLIDEAKEEFDYVILDTAPVGVISDTYLLRTYPDLTLYVVRESVTHKDSVEFINSQREQNRLHNMYLLLNGTSHKNDNYRYGYGQKYGYNNKKIKE